MTGRVQRKMTNIGLHAVKSIGKQGGLLILRLNVAYNIHVISANSFGSSSVVLSQLFSETEFLYDRLYLLWPLY